MCGPVILCDTHYKYNCSHVAKDMPVTKQHMNLASVISVKYEEDTKLLILAGFPVKNPKS